MFEEFSHVVTFSKGLRVHPVVRYYCGKKLRSTVPRDCRKTCFIGWGNKKNTTRARLAASRKNVPYFSLEDGFVRSVGLGAEDPASFSVVKDDLGIYYDATKESRLEKIFMSYDFRGDPALLKKAEEAMLFLRRLRVSKYNHVTENAEHLVADNGKRKILVIGQTAGDLSLVYGFGDKFSLNQLLEAAYRENPAADIYLKIHPDVLAGKKKSDFDPQKAPANCKLLLGRVNPVALLEKMDKVYTKTSQMGFEALMLGKECVCFGMPFYAGWGLTDDRVACERRSRELSVGEVFAGAYILYSWYYDPYLFRKADIIETIHAIRDRRDRMVGKS